MERKPWSSLQRSLILFAALGGVGVMLASWKMLARYEPPATAEPIELVQLAAAESRQYSRSSTVVGTVVSGHAITLRNEEPGTVVRVAFQPGAVVGARDLLVQLDVSLERAELASFEAQARLAKVRLNRLESLSGTSAVSRMDVDTARAESEVALAQVQRVQALIARKTLRAPFRARVGITELGVGQYLAEGQQVTTLQSVDGPTFVDFRVPQATSFDVRNGTTVTVGNPSRPSMQAVVIAMDSLVEAASRSLMVRARLAPSDINPAPGSAVTVRIPVARSREVIVIPLNAVRRGADGDFVFVVRPDENDELRAYQRRVVVESTDDEAALIAEGLVAGDSVASTGSFKLRDGIRVRTGQS
jgi:membrane fusion protein, multidrug efflux system